MSYHPPGPHDVYWAYDSEGRVLYIGCTSSLKKRLDAHRNESEWFPRVERVEAEGFEDYASAIEAERAAIYAERPIFNKQVINPNRLPPIIRRDEPIRVVSEVS